MNRPLLLLVLLTGTIAGGPLAAQDRTEADRRIERLERELRAVQRQVFPGGAPAAAGQPGVLQPEIVPQAPTVTPGNPAQAPVAILQGRVASLESQLQQQTGQIEEMGNTLRQLQARVQAQAEELARRPAPQPERVDPPALGTGANSGNGTGTAAMPGPAADPGRATQVTAVQRPSTGDAAEDGYTYGFRLWQARLFPEAQAELKRVADAHPRHRRYSWAQNLLGRAYLDDGKPAQAAVAFYDNYQANRDGERAADSLYFLGVALTQQNKRPDACRVFDEFNQVYGATARPDLRTQVIEARTRARCRG